MRGAAPQRTGADGAGRERGDEQGRAHQHQGGAERPGDRGGDLGAGDPGPPGVPVRQPAGPLPQQTERPCVQAELVPYGGERGGIGSALGGAGAQHGARGVGPRQPGQEGDPAHQRPGHAHPPGQAPEPPADQDGPAGGTGAVRLSSGPPDGPRNRARHGGQRLVPAPRSVRS